jgi:ribosomal protein L13E
MVRGGISDAWRHYGRGWATEEIVAVKLEPSRARLLKSPAALRSPRRWSKVIDENSERKAEQFAEHLIGVVNSAMLAETRR